MPKWTIVAYADAEYDLPKREKVIEAKDRDEAEGVPKGKWEKVNGAHRCSNCQAYARGYEDIEFLTHFCPACSAELENWED